MLCAGIGREKMGERRKRVVDFLSLLHGTFSSKEKRKRGEKERKMVAVLRIYKSLISVFMNKR
jgi:hypothetical protein